MLIPSALAFLQKHRRHFPKGSTVVDLGDQLLYSREHACSLFPHLRAELLRADINDYDCVTLIYKSLGLENRVCIDFSKNATIRIDLNYSSLAHPDLGEKFDVVTNQGFSEHVFNQASVFECIHHICKPHGLMVHVLPCQGWADGEGWGHGFYQYQPNFFRHLATANNYSLIDMQLSTFSPSDLMLTFSPDIYPSISNPHLLSEVHRRQWNLENAQFTSILVLMQKSNTTSSFSFPQE